MQVVAQANTNPDSVYNWAILSNINARRVYLSLSVCVFLLSLSGVT
jgi:hypothetical protein